MEKELRHIGGRLDFVWHWLAAKGHSGGILLGIKQDVVEVGAFDQGEFFVSTVLRHKKDNFRWEVVVVYGPAQHNLSGSFLEELSSKCGSAEFPLVFGGDF